MHNLFRKSIKIVAGLGLLFLYNCTTVTIPTTEQEKTVYTIDTLFPKERKNIIYINRVENLSILDSFTSSIKLDKQALSVMNSSREIYLAFDEELKTGLDAVITGDYSKRKFEIGLFFSFDWKKVTKDGLSYWKNKDGMSLYFIGDKQIVLSTFSVVPIVNKLQGSILDPPTESIVVLLPTIDDEMVKSLSNGFIKGGINNLSIFLNSKDGFYTLNGVLGLDSDGKARAFSRLVNIFLKIFLSGSQNADIVKISDEFVVSSSNSDVLVSNITISDEILEEIIKNIILYDREADK